MPKYRLEVSDKEYFEKRYECAKEILAGAISHEKIEQMGDSSVQRQAIVFNCITLADMLMEELGYARKMNPDHASVRNLKDLLREEE